MRTLRDVLMRSEKMLRNQNISEPRRVIEDLLSHILRISRMDLYLNFDRYIEEWEWKKLSEGIQRRSKGEPLQHIFKFVDFFSCKIQVSREALIPRQETEILVAKICQHLDAIELGDKLALDLCCGTGCIGLAIKKRFPKLTMILSDISSSCIDLAQTNAQTNGLKVNFLKGDFLTPIDDKKLDFVFCNPPYIPQKEFESLPTDVKDFEPHIALLGGEDGLDYYRRLSSELPRYLAPHARIFLEIGYDQGEKVKQIFNQSHWKRVYYEKDWSRNDRFFFLEFQ